MIIKKSMASFGLRQQKAFFLRGIKRFFSAENQKTNEKNSAKNSDLKLAKNNETPLAQKPVFRELIYPQNSHPLNKFINFQSDDWCLIYTDKYPMKNLRRNTVLFPAITLLGAGLIYCGYLRTGAFLTVSGISLIIFYFLKMNSLASKVITMKLHKSGKRVRMLNAISLVPVEAEIKDIKIEKITWSTYTEDMSLSTYILNVKSEQGVNLTVDFSENLPGRQGKQNPKYFYLPNKRVVLDVIHGQEIDLREFDVSDIDKPKS